MQSTEPPTKDAVERRRKKLVDLKKLGVSKLPVRGIVAKSSENCSGIPVPIQKKSSFLRRDSRCPIDLKSCAVIPPSLKPSISPNTATNKVKLRSNNRPQQIVAAGQRSYRGKPSSADLGTTNSCPAGRLNANCGSVLAGESTKWPSADRTEENYPSDGTSNCIGPTEHNTKSVLARKRRSTKQDSSLHLLIDKNTNESGSELQLLSEEDLHDGSYCVEPTVINSGQSSPRLSKSVACKTAEQRSIQTDVSISFNAMLFIMVPSSPIPFQFIEKPPKTCNASVQVDEVHSTGQKRRCPSSRRDRRLVSVQKISNLRPKNPLFVLFDRMWMDWAQSRLDSYNSRQCSTVCLNTSPERLSVASIQCLIEPALSSSKCAETAVSLFADVCHRVDEDVESKCADLQRIMSKLTILEQRASSKRSSQLGQLTALTDCLNSFSKRIDSLATTIGERIDPLYTRLDSVSEKCKRLKQKMASRETPTVDTAIAFTEPPSGLPRDLLEKEVESLRTALQLKFNELSSLRAKHNDTLYKLERMSEMGERFQLAQQRNEELRALLELRQQNEQTTEAKFSQLLQKCEREAREKRRLLSENEQLSFRLGSLQKHSFHQNGMENGAV